MAAGDEAGEVAEAEGDTGEDDGGPDDGGSGLADELEAKPSDEGLETPAENYFFDDAAEEDAGREAEVAAHLFGSENGLGGEPRAEDAVVEEEGDEGTEDGDEEGG